MLCVYINCMQEALLYRDDERHHFAQSHLFLVKNRIRYDIGTNQ